MFFEPHVTFAGDVEDDLLILATDEVRFGSTLCHGLLSFRRMFTLNVAQDQTVHLGNNHVETRLLNGLPFKSFL